ncbi:cyclic diguanylate phosphodiesterase [Fibrobacterales bacterium]|nr:cyclic diguanylate phosphodiesterase [Fibrobacterales bacterium]
MGEKIFIARQPILSRDRKLVAYELLFRKKAGDLTSGTITNDTSTTAKVLDNALNSIGIQNLVGSKFAFLNCGYEMLSHDILSLLDKNIFVLEIIENANIDANLTQNIQTLNNKGFKIAVDDFIPTDANFERIKPILEYVNFVKIDLPFTNLNEVKGVVEKLHSLSILVLAEKVETEQEFKMCYDAGMDFFQGYFFAKPEMMSAAKIGASGVGVFQVLDSINKDMDFDKLEDSFKNLPDLTALLLKYLNSAFFATRNEIKSVRHAITMLGLANMRRWLLILVYANNDGEIKDSPLLINSVQRAKFFEELSHRLHWEKLKIEKAYLMGLLSHLDALYKIPLAEVLQQIPLDKEIEEALLEGTGTLSRFMDLAIATENGNQEKITEIIDDLGIAEESFEECVLESYNFSFENNENL